MKFFIILVLHRFRMQGGTADRQTNKQKQGHSDLSPKTVGWEKRPEVSCIKSPWPILHILVVHMSVRQRCKKSICANVTQSDCCFELFPPVKFVLTYLVVLSHWHMNIQYFHQLKVIRQRSSGPGRGCFSPTSIVLCWSLCRWPKANGQEPGLGVPLGVFRLPKNNTGFEANLCQMGNKLYNREEDFFY